VFVEGTPVPGSQRADELHELAVKAFVPEWEQVARNLAQAMLAYAHEFSALDSINLDAAEEMLGVFAKQCAAHGITP